MTGTLILPEWLIDIPGAPPKQGWGVRVVGDAVDAVAPNDELLLRHPADEVWEAPGQALAPGFVDAHTHLYGVLAHGIPLDKAPSGFWPFLVDFWWPLVEDQLDHEMICAATDLNLDPHAAQWHHQLLRLHRGAECHPRLPCRPGRGRPCTRHPGHPLV